LQKDRQLLTETMAQTYRIAVFNSVDGLVYDSLTNQGQGQMLSERPPTLYKVSTMGMVTNSL
jgi:hypothetical protein